MNYTDFASRIKEKYPVYLDMDDNDLAKRMVEKYPEYSDVTFDEPVSVPASGQLTTPTIYRSKDVSVPSETVEEPYSPIAEQQIKPLSVDELKTASLPTSSDADVAAIQEKQWRPQATVAGLAQRIPAAGKRLVGEEMQKVAPISVSPEKTAIKAQKIKEEAKVAGNASELVDPTWYRSEKIQERINEIKGQNPNIANSIEMGDIAGASDILVLNAFLGGNDAAKNSALQTARSIREVSGERTSKQKKGIVGTVENAINATAEMLPMLGKSAALSSIPIIGPALTSSMWVQQGAGEVITDLKEEGVEDDVALAYGLLGALPYAAVEQLQIGQILGTGAKKAVSGSIKKKLSQIAKEKGKDTFKEMAEEGTQAAILESVTIDALKESGIEVDDEKSRIINSFIEDFKASAGPMGILSLLGFGAGAAGVRRGKATKTKAMLETGTPIERTTPKLEIQKGEPLSLSDYNKMPMEEKDKNFYRLSETDQERTAAQYEEIDDETEVGKPISKEKTNEVEEETEENIEAVVPVETTVRPTYTEVSKKIGRRREAVKRVVTKEQRESVESGVSAYQDELLKEYGETRPTKKDVSKKFNISREEAGARINSVYGKQEEKIKEPEKSSIETIVPRKKEEVDSRGIEIQNILPGVKYRGIQEGAKSGVRVVPPTMLFDDEVTGSTISIRPNQTAEDLQKKMRDTRFADNEAKIDEIAEKVEGLKYSGRKVIKLESGITQLNKVYSTPDGKTITIKPTDTVELIQNKIKGDQNVQEARKQAETPISKEQKIADDTKKILQKKIPEEYRPQIVKPPKPKEETRGKTLKELRLEEEQNSKRGEKQRRPAVVKRTAEDEKYTPEYWKEQHTHNMNVGLYNALRYGWKDRNGKEQKGMQEGWIDDYNIITDSKIVGGSKNQKLSQNAKDYLQNVVDNVNDNPEYVVELEKLGIKKPEQPDDVVDMLQQSKSASEFIKFHKEYEKNIRGEEVNEDALNDALEIFYEEPYNLSVDQKKVLENHFQAPLNDVLQKMQGNDDFEFEDTHKELKPEDYKQQDLFGEEKSVKQLETDAKKAIEKAEIKSRIEKRKGGEADMSNLPLFEDQDIEGSQSTLKFAKKKSKKTVLEQLLTPQEDYEAIEVSDYPLKGFLLPEGNYLGVVGVSDDHRVINDLVTYPDDDDTAYGARTKKMFRIMEDANLIRFTPEANAFQLKTEPTSQQIRAISRYIRENGQAEVEFKSGKSNTYTEDNLYELEEDIERGGVYFAQQDDKRNIGTDEEVGRRDSLRDEVADDTEKTERNVREAEKNIAEESRVTRAIYSAYGKKPSKSVVRISKGGPVQSAVAEAISEITDDPVVLIEVDTKTIAKDGITGFDGFRYNDKIYLSIATSSDRPLLWTAFHEWYHGLTDNERKFIEEAAAVTDAGWKRISDKGNEEFFADISGEIMSRPETLEYMAKENPVRLRKIIQKLIDTINTLVDKFKRLVTGDKEAKYTKYVTNAEAIRDRLVEVLKNRKLGRDMSDGVSYAMQLFHGSPYDFDKFEIRPKTGEGAMAFGYGIYFTDKKGIAEYYAERLSDVVDYNGTIDGKDIAEYSTDSKLEGMILQELIKTSTYPETATSDIGELRSIIKSNVVEKNYEYFDPYYSDFTEKEIGDALKLIDRYDVEVEKNRNLYTITLHKGKEPSEYDYIKWGDKPTDKQVSKIKAQAAKENVLQGDIDALPDLDEGATLYHALSASLGGDKEASEFLLRSGVDGIEYPAGTLSGVDSDAKNYVVFDPEAVTIEDKTRFAKADQTKAEAFKKWFAESKVIDENGEPLIVYHGRPRYDKTNKKINKFSRRYLGRETYGNANDPSYAATSMVGFWSNSEKIEGKNSPYDEHIELYYKIEQPKRYNTLEELANELYAYINEDDNRSEMKRHVERYVEVMKLSGYDGVIIEEDSEFGGTSYIAFDPNQIKSATENTGTFDPKNPDIRFSKKYINVPSTNTVFYQIGDVAERKKELRKKLGKIKESLLDDRIVLENDIKKLDDKNREYIAASIIGYAQRIGLRGEPYNRVDVLVKNVKTAKGFMRAIEVMDNVMEKRNHRRYYKSAKETIKDAYSYLKKIEGKTRPTTDLETNRALKTYLDTISGEISETTRKAKLMAEYYANHQDDDIKANRGVYVEELGEEIISWIDESKEDVPEQAQKYIATLSSNGLEGMSNSALVRIIRDIKTIRKTGKTIKQIHDNKERLRIEEAAQKIAAEVKKNSKDVQLKTPAQKAAGSVHEAEKRRRFSIKNAGNMVYSALETETILERVAGTKGESTLKTEVFDRMYKAVSTEKKNLKTAIDKFHERYSGIDISFVSHNPLITIEIDGYDENNNLKKIDLTLTYNEGMYFYAMSMNDSQREALIWTLARPATEKDFDGNKDLYNEKKDEVNEEKHKIGESLIDEVVNALPEEYKELVRKQWGYYKDDQHSRINAEYVKVHGIDMPSEEYYFPISRDFNSASNMVNLDLMERMGFRKAKVSGKFTISRVASRVPIKKFDYFGTVIGNMLQAEHYIAFNEPVNNVRRILNNPDVHDEIYSYNPEAWNNIDDWLKALTYGRSDYGTREDWTSKAIKWVRKNSAVFQLGFKAISTMIQSSSYFRGISQVKHKYIAKSWGELAKAIREGKVKEYFKAIDDLSPIMASREHDSEQILQEWFEAGIADKILKTEKAGQRLKSIAMKPMSAYDKFLAAMIWKAKFDEVINTGSFTTEKEAIDKAVYEADKVVRRTQSGGGMLTSTGMQRGAEWQRMYTQYASDSIKGFNMLISFFDHFNEMDVKEKAAIVGYGFILPAIVANFIRSGFKPPWEEPEEVAIETVKSFSDGLPLVGTIANTIAVVGTDEIKQLRGKPTYTYYDYVTDPNAPVIGIVKDAATSIKEGIIDHKLYKAVGVAGQAIGIPGGAQAIRTIKEGKTILEGGNIGRIIFGSRADREFDLVMRHYGKDLSESKNPELAAKYIKWAEKQFKSWNEDKKIRYRKYVIGKKKEVPPETLERIEREQGNIYSAAKERGDKQSAEQIKEETKKIRESIKPDVKKYFDNEMSKQYPKEFNEIYILDSSENRVDKAKAMAEKDKLTIGQRRLYINFKKEKNGTSN